MNVIASEAKQSPNRDWRLLRRKDRSSQQLCYLSIGKSRALR